MIEHKNIFEALLAVYNEVGYVQKTSSTQLKYTFASEGAFIRSLRPSLIEHGITISVLNMSDLTQEQYQAGYEGKTTMTRSTIHGSVRFQHVAGSFIDVQAYGEGADTGDKSVNKAMTDMYKYALRQTFMIETGDDPDKDASEERKPSMVDTAKQLGAVEKKAMTHELAKSAKTSDGIPYTDLPKEELIQHFNGLSQKRKKPEEWTEEYQFKFDAAKFLINNWGKS